MIRASRNLARQVTARSSSNYTRAKAIEHYLKTNFGYTLELPGMREPDPLARFLFERKKGHCEYFASSMTMMLRTLGIPARMVNGFRGGEYNDLTNSYIVREKDAHSWVEAYFPSMAGFPLIPLRQAMPTIRKTAGRAWRSTWTQPARSGASGSSITTSATR